MILKHHFQKNISFAVFLLAINGIAPARAASNKVSASKSVDTGIYSVTVAQNNSEKSSPVYKSDCPAYQAGYMGMQTKDNIPLTQFLGRSISWTNFSFKDSVRVKVTVLNETKVPVNGLNVRILPSRFGIKPTVVGNVVTFTLTTPGQYSVEIGENGFKNGLMVFANPPETDVPNASDSTFFVVQPNNTMLIPADIPATCKGIYFKKGAHDIGVFQIPSQIKRVYFADSAWVYGALQIHNNIGVKVYGRGILSSAKLNYRVSHCIDTDVDSVTVEGIVVADPKYFAVRLMGSHNQISWVKVIGGWVYNCDGITGYTDSKVSHCFIWANDDAIKVYLSNIIWSDIVVWQLNNGGIIQMSWGRTQALDCTISRVDVLHAEWVKAGFNAALLSCVGNHYDELNRYSLQKNWLIEDVVTETPVPVVFGINPDSFSANDIRNITLKNWNVKMTKGSVFKNKIVRGYPDTILDGFVFDNVIFNDTLLTKDNWIKVMSIDTAGLATPLFLPLNSESPFVRNDNYPIYPNPVETVLTIQNAKEDSVLNVYNTNYMLVATGKGKKLKVTDLTKGFYLLAVDNKYTGKFIKK